MEKRKILKKREMKDWLNKFFPEKKLEDLFEYKNQDEETWQFINVKGIMIGRLIVTGEERYFVLPQVRMYF